MQQEEILPLSSPRPELVLVEMSWGQVGAALEGPGGHGGQCSDAYKLLHMPGGSMGMPGSDKRRDKSSTLLKLVSLVMPSYGVRDGGRV